MIISLLYKSSPSDVKLIMIDPKMVELSNYNGIPHLLIPVVTDPKKAAGALQWAVNEMMRRYQDFAQLGVREIESYNSIVRANPELGEHKAKIVVFIDELADLMIAAAKEVEEAICRVAQMGRAAGMHLVIATQRPSSDVITGLMKANIPSRIALAVASSLDSRIILDASGAENLVGNGDMLFAPLGKPKRRVQGCFISDEEVNAVIDFVKSNAPAQYSDDVLQQVEENARNNEKGKKGAGPSGDSIPESSSGPKDDRDPLYYDAVDVVIETGMASASMLQRRLKLGYSRAARLVDQMEEGGVVGPFEGSKPRKLLLTKEQWAEQKLRMSEGTGLDDGLELAKAMSAAADEEQALRGEEQDAE
jgi:S-DNA-T family DNA segregation ATPase FtsK/SpoIIIE